METTIAWKIAIKQVCVCVCVCVKVSVGLHKFVRRYRVSVLSSWPAAAAQRRNVHAQYR